MRSGMPDGGPAFASAQARDVVVRGLVQGVGFRPFVHRLALRHRLAGWVRNTNGSVEIRIEGDHAQIETFLSELTALAPPLAAIEHVTSRVVPPESLARFEVRISSTTTAQPLPVSPDVAMCDACRRELLDPSNRRYRYPFITCTDCGPRFTVIESMPYDRERTTMAAFTQCPACTREYATPGDRRYHSETNSCSACGPHLWLERSREHIANGARAIEIAAEMLRDGKIVAVRGLGGFQLAANALDAQAVAALRRRKHREGKPLAVMVSNLEMARRFATVSAVEAALLASAAAPIVTCRTRYDVAHPLAPNVAPDLAHVGIMVAYTPLHVLLLDAAGVPLIMTSGNDSEEPIAIAIGEARRRLAHIADALLLHDREIVARYDDSVVRVIDDAPVLLRRARGYAPLPVDLPVESPEPVLAVGPHLKNTFTLLDRRRAWVSQHIGDLEDLETLEHFHAARDRYQLLFGVRPTVVAHDLHPGYLSTRLAEESGLALRIPVQHHHAHIAAVLAEHGRTDPVIGVAYDGTGYGDDGHVWGSEILHADLAGYQRLGHLRYAPLPGGDASVRSPWRVALGYFSLGTSPAEEVAGPMPGVGRQEHDIATRQLARQVNTPLASSMGRLFDAAAAVLGIRYQSQYEGQAAMELEALALDHAAPALPFGVVADDGQMIFDPLPLLHTLQARMAAGESRDYLAAAFHETVVAATAAMVCRARETTGTNVVALGGGCFQNARLLSSTRRVLRGHGFEVLVARRFGPNDGAVSLGQAAVAAARLAGIGSNVSNPTPISVHGG